MNSLVGVAAEDGHVLWQPKRKGSTGGKLYLRDQEVLLCYDVTSR